MGNSDNNADFPWLIDVDAFMTAKSHTNWNTVTLDSTQINQGRRSSTGAQNAEVAWDVMLAAGTWKVEIFMRTDTDKGIYSVRLDDVEVGTIDGYSASATNNVRGSVSGIAVTRSGKYELELRMATKNGSSSSYVGWINSVQLTRTA
jgi:hypothetical protein